MSFYSLLTASAVRFIILVSFRRIRCGKGEPYMSNGAAGYPVKLSIDYPDRKLDRLASFFRIFTVLPIGFV